MRSLEEKKYNEKIPGWFSIEDLRVLEDLSMQVPDNGIIIEVGSLHGRSSYCLAKTNPNAKIICIDLWSGQEIISAVIDGINNKNNNSLEVFKNFTKDCQNITTIKAGDPSKIQWDDQKIDMVFIDANHTNPSDWNWIEFWIEKLKANGIICGHDYNLKDFPDVKENVTKLESILNLKVTLYPNSLMWSFKT